MRVQIENYRGYDIIFETYDETFATVINDDYKKEKQSYSAVKKYIDDYLRSNIDFKSITICKFPSITSDYTKAKIIGIRKDGKYAIEKSDGSKGSISDYDDGSYYIKYSVNDSVIKELDALNEKEKAFDLQIGKERQAIMSKLRKVTLKEYKANLTNKS